MKNDYRITGGGIGRVGNPFWTVMRNARKGGSETRATF